MYHEPVDIFQKKLNGLLMSIIQVSKDMLTEVQSQLERAFPSRKLMFPVTTTLEIRQELKAATVSTCTQYQYIIDQHSN